jgi:hypothetical protein
MMAVKRKIMLVFDGSRSHPDVPPTIGTRGLRRNAGAFSGEFPDSTRSYQMGYLANSIESFIHPKKSHSCAKSELSGWYLFVKKTGTYAKPA